jgi:hypothetical protein
MVGERAVHRPRHHDRQDKARGAVQRVRDDQQFALEHEAQLGAEFIAVQEYDSAGATPTPSLASSATPMIGFDLKSRKRGKDRNKAGR